MAIVQRVSSKNEFLKQVQEKITFAFQPIVNIHTGDCFGFEALLRNHKLVGVESIPAFFDHAVDLGVLHHVDSILREITVRRFAALPLSQSSMLFFNVDGRLFENAGGELEGTTTLFSEFDLQTQLFCLELSEAYDNESARYVGDVLKICREQGFFLAIDDFGRGFSELKMLYQHRPDVVKIDRFFINGIPDDSKKRLFVSTIVDLAHVLGATVIAEGVQTEGEFLSCKEIGCDLVQGFYVARPTTDLGALRRTYDKVVETNRRDRRKRESDAHLIRKWMSSPPTLNIHAKVSDVRDVIAADVAHPNIPVLNDTGRPIGVVGRSDLVEILAGTQKSGVDTNASGTIQLDRLAMSCPISDINNDIETILKMYGGGDDSHAIVVTEASAFAGMLDADSLVHLLKEGSLGSARDRNELTKLPGSNSIMRYMAEAMKRVEVNTTFARLELRNFKPFNEVVSQDVV